MEYKREKELMLQSYLQTMRFLNDSTDEILYKAVVDSMLFTDLKQGRFSEVPIDDGTILKIKPDGILEHETFHFYESAGFAWWEYGGYPVKNAHDRPHPKYAG